jgi:hypothetical protein
VATRSDAIQAVRTGCVPPLSLLLQQQQLQLQQHPPAAVATRWAWLFSRVTSIGLSSESSFRSDSSSSASGVVEEVVVCENIVRSSTLWL